MVVATAPDTPCLQPLQMPQRLTEQLRLTPEQFELVCQANPDAALELSADGQLIAMTPTGSETSARNSTLLVLLGIALRSSGLPLKLFDSSGGFRLPDGSVLSPDAALVRLERWQALSPEQQRSFAPLCPDVVIELASPSDEGRGAPEPCAAKWSSTGAMAPNSRGCCCPPSRPSKSGVVALGSPELRPSLSPGAHRSSPDARCW